MVGVGAGEAAAAGSIGTIEGAVVPAAAGGEGGGTGTGAVADVTVCGPVTASTVAEPDCSCVPGDGMPRTTRISEGT